MTNYRKILELYSQGYSQKSIETAVRSSHQTAGFNGLCHMYIILQGGIKYNTIRYTLRICSYFCYGL